MRRPTVRMQIFWCLALVSPALAAAAVAAGGLAARAVAPTASAAQAPDTIAKVDAVFSQWSSATPGCAIGVSVGGTPILQKAYGMADLEHAVENTPETIFESGSVAKQFTAAAVLLLARDGKLSLDDPARKFIPELWDFGQPLTIRHMLNHSSGLRDWGNVASIAGWPRTSRVHTHAHVLDIVSRQRALNFTPGARYSYSNTGYNLAAIIVSRVSGMSFADFTRTRIFEPLGMTRTSWRDDHTRIVKDRAIAYSGDRGLFRILMPFENVHGNGGLLTTVGDLLKWNENFHTLKVGDRSFVEEQQRPGRFNDGRAHGYALGLRVGTRNGVFEVAHSGSTAGYRAHLNRYPEARVSAAVLCNASGANATRYANDVADLYLAERLKPTDVAATHVLTPPEIDAAAGLYRSTLTGDPMTIVRAGEGVRIEQGPPLFAMSAARFVTESGLTLELGKGTARITDRYGSVEQFVREAPWAPGAAVLRELAGTYASGEAEVEYRAELDGEALVLKRRPDATIRLTPSYKDAFTGSLGTVIFRRESGRVTGFSVVQDRVWDLRFARR
ncbi:MAG: serine hydrolase domain-containing protein [Acidobacteriota bacterium]